MTKHSTHEALTQMGAGLIDYNRGVLTCIGRRDLWLAWNFARVSVDSAHKAFQRRMDSKYGAEAAQEKLLDNGAEFPEAAALDRANAALADAWKPIQSLIDGARDALRS